MNSLILCTAVRSLHPLLLLFSVFLLIHGHHDPGGGFAGGLVAATAFVLHAIAHDTAATRQALRVDPRTLIGLGLASALGSGMPALFSGDPYLKATWIAFDLPAFGQVSLGTPLLFDAGVYLVVVGVTLNIVFALAEE